MTVESIERTAQKIEMGMARIANTSHVKVSEVGGAATIVLPAHPTKRNVIYSAEVSYDAAADGGQLTVFDGANKVFDLDISMAGDRPTKRIGIKGGVGNTMTISLAGVASRTAKLNILAGVE